MLLVHLEIMFPTTCLTAASEQVSLNDLSISRNATTDVFYMRSLASLLIDEESICVIGLIVKLVGFYKEVFQLKGFPSHGYQLVFASIGYEGREGV